MADIVTVPEGNFTPGALAALQNAANVINAAWNQANSKTSSFETKIDGIESWIVTNTPANIVAGSSTPPSVVEPNVDIPSSVNTGDVMSLFDTKYLELVALLADKFVQFRTAYFPDDSAAYGLVEDWVQAAINNPTQGLPTAVANQILTDSKDKIIAEASRATDSVMQTFAARRYPLPPGAAAGAAIQIQMTAQNNIGEAGRKLTMASIEQMRFAVEKCISLRQLAMSSAVEYIKALASGPEMASRVVNIGYDAQSKLISAASQFYGARTEVAKLATQNEQFNVTSAMQAAEKNQVKDLTLIEDKLKALLTEATAFAQMATSMYNNLHASAGTSYSVSVS